MADKDEFEPRLGKLRSWGGKRGQRYLQQALQAVARAGGWPRHGRSGFVGSRIGRGSAPGSILRDRHGAFRSRRVVIKSRIMKLGEKGMKAAATHLRYIQREGVTREGGSGELYKATEDRAEGRDFLKRCKGDRHQFRFIVAAEDGVEYETLRDLTRRLMARMEDDLDTRLDWVAVDHHNTGHPHTHIILRGKDDKGKDLVIARTYMAHGMRERACEIVTLDLGPRTDIEIESRLRDEVGQERFTGLDKELLRRANDQGIVLLGEPVQNPHTRFQQSLRTGRLQKLKRLGLAEELSPGRWQLKPELESTLRRMGERDDIIKTLHKAMSKEKIERSATDQVIYEPSDTRAEPITGRLIERGLSDEINDRHYLMVDGVDGRTHYVEIGMEEATESISTGAILHISPKSIEPRKSDRTIAEIAAAHGGRYNIHTHMDHDKNCSWEFAQTHVRRLEAMRRAGFATCEPDGTWTIPTNHLEKARAYEQKQARLQPVIVEVLSRVNLDQQIGAEAATWLDKELVAGNPASLRDSGFGQQVKNALAQRRQWLFQQGLAEEQEGKIIYRRDMLTTLRSRELSRVAVQLSKELGLAYTEAPRQGRIEGTYRRSLDLTSGKFAVIEKSREFTLVPWRPVLERNLGKSVSGLARGDEISWTIGRRGLSR
ncbi:MAG TPA: relaxase/mobilization nuclease RlxS [Dongiaceae bacterium]|jgi:type IV secretory pathway VirD2 relaxase|nr:relaxase/mobilization nuclease RlxS [Dongiaceae bacterium]